MNLKQKTKDETQCEAMRCTNPRAEMVPGDAFGRAGGLVGLCARHIREAAAAGSIPAGAATVVEAAPTAAAPRAIGAVMAAPDLTAERAEATETLALARDFAIETREQLETAAEVLADVKTRAKALEARRDEITRPMNDALRSTRDLFRPVLDAFAQIEKTLKDKITAFSAAQAEHNARAMAAAAEASAAGDGEGTDAALARVANVGNLEGVSLRRTWEPIVVDENAVPIEYLIVTIDTAAIKKLSTGLKADEMPPEVPGIRWEQRTTAAVRT